MTSYRLARVYLFLTLAAVAAAAAAYLFHDYHRLLETEELESFERQTRLKNQISSRTREGFAQSLAELVSAARRIMEDSGEPFSKGLKIIEASKAEVRRAFYVDRSMISLPQWQKFRIPKSREPAPLSLGEKAEFKLAEILEYQDRDFEGAVRLYETFWLKNPDDFAAANALARCRVKLQQWEQAEKIYRQIYAQNPAPLSTGDVPLALTAAFQLLTLYQTSEQPRRLHEFGAEVYEDLINETWELPEDMAVFVRTKLHGQLEPYLREPRFQRLRARDRELTALKNDVRFISNRVLPLVENTPIGDFKILFLSPSNEARFFLLIIPFRAGHIILEADTGRFLDTHLLGPLRALAKDFPQAGLRLLSDGRAVLTAAETRGTVIRYPLSGHFPEWELELTLPSPSSKTEAGRRHRRLGWFLGGYGGFLGFLALIGIVVGKQMQLAEMKSDFVSHVSHELKTPLTSLRMFSEMLLRRQPVTPAKRRQYHQIMHGETLRLARLIENLLDLSRIEGKKIRFHFQPEPLNAVLRGALQIFKNTGNVDPRRVRADFKTPVSLVMDRDAVVQMLLNLLDNARKFSGEHDAIEVRSWKMADTVRLAVTDHGIGMSRAETRKVFKKFYQVKRSYEDRFKGVGLGLTIVHHIVLAHHGRIWVESEPGRGTTITVELPLVRPAAEAAERMNRHAHPADRGR